MVPQLISIPVLDEHNNQKWEAFLENNHLAPVAKVFTFLVQSLVCVIFFLTAYSHLMKNSKKCCRNSFCSSFSEKEFMQDPFGKVVDSEVRDYLMSGAGKASLGEALGGETGEVTVLFCDIRTFTAIDFCCRCRNQG